MSLAYEELRVLAKAQLRRGQAPLRTTALVHEAYMKLGGNMEVDWGGRAHFFAIASRAMRQILIDHARRRNAKKRGGEWERTTLTSASLGIEVKWDDLIALDHALEHLDQIDGRCRQVVEYRFFGGMTEEEVAAVLDVSTRTVQRDWNKARAFLYRELYGEEA